MKILNFANEADATSRLGLLLNGDRVVDLSQCRDAPFDTRSMHALIDAGTVGLNWMRATAEQGLDTLSLDSLRIFAPIPQPRKNVFCVGWNYLEHFKEGEQVRTTAVDLPEHPTFFTKASTTINGPYDPILINERITQKLDWEVELGVVIGKRGRDIDEHDALGYIWGYTVINDVTGRDIQRQHGQQWFKGKSLDGSCPMGPCIVTADAIDPINLQLICRVNGVIKQDSNTRHMYFSLARVIAELSQGLTLHPGDIIATGTPQGVGHARQPPEFLQDGDLLESEIPGIGCLRNVISRRVTA